MSGQVLRHLKEEPALPWFLSKCHSYCP